MENRQTAVTIPFSVVRQTRRQKLFSNYFRQ
jgi:hypothetical protein